MPIPSVLMHILTLFVIATAHTLPLITMMAQSRGLLENGWAHYPRFAVSSIFTIMVAIYIAVNIPYRDIFGQMATWVLILSWVMVGLSAILFAIHTFIVGDQKEPLSGDERE